MSGRKIILSVLFFAAFFVSCGNQEVDEYTPEGLEGAVEDGIILYLPRAEEPRFETVEFKLRDMTRTVSFSSIRFAFSSHEMLTFEMTGGYVDVVVRAGDFVNKGDVLAVLSFEDENMITHKRQAQIRLEQFIRNSAVTENRLLELIDEARDNLNFATNNNQLEWNLRLELALVELELFRARRAIQVEELHSALAEIYDIMAGDKILAPFDGLIFDTFQHGSFLTANHIIIIMADHRDFFLIADPVGSALVEMPHQMSRYALFRFGDVLRVRSQRTFVDDYGIVRPIAVFYAKVASDPWAAGLRDNLTYTLIPLDRQAFFDQIYEAELSIQEGLSMLLSTEMNINLTPGIYSLPRPAVRQVDWNNHYIRVLYNGVPSRRYVLVGVQDRRAIGGYIQILSGVEEGMQVVIPR